MGGRGGSNGSDSEHSDGRSGCVGAGTVAKGVGLAATAVAAASGADVIWIRVRMFVRMRHANP